MRPFVPGSSLWHRMGMPGEGSCPLRVLGGKLPRSCSHRHQESSFLEKNKQNYTHTIIQVGAGEGVGTTMSLSGHTARKYSLCLHSSPRYLQINHLGEPRCCTREVQAQLEEQGKTKAVPVMAGTQLCGKEIPETLLCLGQTPKFWSPHWIGPKRNLRVPEPQNKCPPGSTLLPSGTPGRAWLPPQMVPACLGLTVHPAVTQM